MYFVNRQSAELSKRAYADVDFSLRNTLAHWKKNIINNHWLIIRPFHNSYSLTRNCFQAIIESLLTRSSWGNLLESILGKRKYFSTINIKKWDKRPLQLYLWDKKGLAMLALAKILLTVHCVIIHLKVFYLIVELNSMVIWIVKFLREGYKIR